MLPTMAPGPGGRRQFFPWGVANPTFYLTALFLVAAAATGVVAVMAETLLAIAAAVASFMVGGLLGLIFGIPRYAASAADREVVDNASGIVKYRANTNLEQISDWLTKILVGIGLTQFRSIGQAFVSVAQALGEALTGTESTSATMLAGAAMLSSAIPGFIFFYLWSRVYLPEIFRRAEES